MEHITIWAFALLFFKHWIIDFCLQTPEMAKGKAIYGDVDGCAHAMQHGIGTLIVTSLLTHGILPIILGIIDAVIHYHIDYVKARFGNKESSNSHYWIQFGFDQFLHQLTYLGIICWIVV